MTDVRETPVQLPDGYDAFARLWLPKLPCEAVLYLHGIQSHGEWFLASAQRLADAGLAVLLPDRRGSGRNNRSRGHAGSPGTLLRDCAACLDVLKARTGRERAHVVGVSWGGKLALALARYAPERVQSLALIAPGLFPLVDLPMAEKLRVAACAVTARRSTFPIPLDDPELFTGNPERIRYIREDPLSLRRVTAAFLVTSRRLDRYARAVSRDRVRLPLRVFLAGHDRIIHNNRTRDFIRRLSWPDRDIIEYPDAHHTLEFEPDPRPFLDDLVAWVTGGQTRQA